MILQGRQNMPDRPFSNNNNDFQEFLFLNIFSETTMSWSKKATAILRKKHPVIDEGFTIVVNSGINLGGLKATAYRHQGGSSAQPH